MTETGVLSAWEVTEEVEDRFRKIAPCRLEDQVKFGRVESCVDTMPVHFCLVFSVDERRNGRDVTHKRFLYTAARALSELSSAPKS